MIERSEISKERIRELREVYGDRYIAYSPSNPEIFTTFGALWFAQRFVDGMNNVEIEEYDENPYGVWNKELWKEKPQPWIIEEINI